MKYIDTKGIEIAPAEFTSIPPKIKEIWAEADKKQINIKEIVEKVRKVRPEIYNEEYEI
ncbi:Uncharacterised protein [uncultured archaeon]|nr:Uncharacterised protein [uncultured archaeon]